MARNEEKSRSMLNRWQEMKRNERFGGQRNDRRPSHTSQEDSAERAMQWRNEIIKDVSALINEIQNDKLDEHRIRDLNDDINKRMRLKRAWEHRVMELGGPNFLAAQPTQFVDSGVAPDMKGGAYRYYGAAKNLPGVRDLLKQATETERHVTQSIDQLRRAVDVAYYGYMDDDDGVLAPLELKAEKRTLAEREERWNEEQKRLKTEEAAAANRSAQSSEAAAKRRARDTLSSVDAAFVSHVTLPSRDEIEQLIVARRKKELLKQYETRTE